jgi:hypothetical protein
MFNKLLRSGLWGNKYYSKLRLYTTKIEDPLYQDVKD